jgi:hypothetical protein
MSTPPLIVVVHPVGHEIVLNGHHLDYISHADETPVRLEIAGDVPRERIAEIVLSQAERHMGRSLPMLEITDDAPAT